MYVLVTCLTANKLTAFQFSPTGTHILLFNKHGVHHISTNTSSIDLANEVEEGTWALVDANKHVGKPVELLDTEGSPFIVVVASSPHPT